VIYGVFVACVRLFAHPYDVIPATLWLALGLGAGLLVIDGLGWRLTSAAFNRERLITATR
jgi:hypothetical protein